MYDQTDVRPSSVREATNRCIRSRCISKDKALSLIGGSTSLSLLLLASRWRCRARTSSPPPAAWTLLLRLLLPPPATFELPPSRCCGSYRAAAPAAPTVIYARRQNATVRKRAANGDLLVVYGVSCSGLGCIRKLADRRICGGD